jgi:hypothetical protein
MKKINYDFMRGKNSNNRLTSKEINLSFTQYQSKNLLYNNNNNNSNNNNTEKINFNTNSNSVSSFSNLENNSKKEFKLNEIEKEFYINNITMINNQIDNLKKFLILKTRILNKLKEENLNLTYNEIQINQQKKIYEKKLNEVQKNYNILENNLTNEIKYIHLIENELEDFTLRKYQLKLDIERLNKLKEKCINENKNNNNNNKNISKDIFNRIDTNEINNQYDPVMTTTGNEMCRSRLGNKLLLSLNVGEINKNISFNRMNLAYPVLKRKKIQFSLETNPNTGMYQQPKMGKKKINLNNFNNFDAGNFNDGSQTVC